MKRHPALRPLSDDHHRALVLARRLRRHAGGGPPGELEALSLETRREFEAALEPHFQVEERWLLPALRAHGAGTLADRTADEHGRLRALVRDRWDSDVPARLGALLDAHVRFEERSVFPTAETLLSEAELAAAYEASRSRASGRRRRRTRSASV